MTTRGPEDGTGGYDVVVVLRADEVAFLANAVTESLEAVEEWEYDTRLGGSRRTAQQLRRRLKASLRPDDELRRPGDLPDDLPSFRRPAGRSGSPVPGRAVRRHTVVLGEDSVVVEVDESRGSRSWEVGVVSARGRWQLSVAGWRGICFGTGGGTAYAWTAREVLVLLGTGAPGPAEATTPGRGVLHFDDDLVVVFRRAGRWVAVCETSVRVLQEDRVVTRVELGDAVASAAWVGSRLEVGLVDGGRLVVPVDG